MNRLMVSISDLKFCLKKIYKFFEKTPKNKTYNPAERYQQGESRSLDSGNIVQILGTCRKMQTYIPIKQTLGSTNCAWRTAICESVWASLSLFSPVTSDFCLQSIISSVALLGDKRFAQASCPTPRKQQRFERQGLSLGGWSILLLAIAKHRLSFQKKAIVKNKEP